MNAQQRERWKKYLLKTVKVYDSLPKGWKVNVGATTAPNGYAWISNGKSLFGGEYEHALLKLA